MFWEQFRKYTQARINLGHSGSALPTKEWLEFSLNHALSVDTLTKHWEVEKLQAELKTLKIPAHIINSQIQKREEYLLRPDLGRQLKEESLQFLKTLSPQPIMLIITNGLSTKAIDHHALFLLEELMPKINSAHILLIPEARVGILNACGEILKPEIGIILVGERPGLSADDSLGVYLAYRPKAGQSDVHRNCISNIRPPHGLSYSEAAKKIDYFMKEFLHQKTSGVLIKDQEVNYHQPSGCVNYPI